MKPLSQNSKIWVAVVFIHLIGIIFISTSTIKEKKTEKKLLVVTKQFTPKTVTPTLIHKIEKPAPLPPIPKKNLQNKIVPLKKAPPQAKAKPPQKSSKQVLKKIDQRLAKPHTTVPKTPPPPLVEAALPPYIDSACLIFREALLLPEKGQVKLTVSVEPNGKIGKMEIETYESKKNLEYLMAVLPTLSLPPPERGKETTFTVLFCND